MNIAFRAAETEDARRALELLVSRHGQASLDDAEVIVALGGDGFMLETMHANLGRNVPIYGMNLGTVGFLLNGFDPENMAPRIEAARAIDLFPLRMRARLADGSIQNGLGINDVYIFRETRQAASLAIDIDGVCRLPQLVCDGVIIATPAGSTAYNSSAHGPILPVDANLLALTPISPFRPRRWRGALLSSRSRFKIRVLDPIKRPVSAVADFTEVRDVLEVDIWEDRSEPIRLLFDPEHNLEERILKEQFIP